MEDVPCPRKTRKLIDEGWGQAKATEFVTTIDERVGPRTGGHRRQSGGGGGGGGGWLVWIGILALVNLLSDLFDWSFWIY